MTNLQEHRERFARQIVNAGGRMGVRLIDAFAATPRENYLGPPPWPLLAMPGTPPQPIDDPRLLYEDVLVALCTRRGINNGQPSLHAQCLAACAPDAGDTVIQVGAGTGYYSAILAQLVGAGGQVIAYEIETDLAERAHLNLRAWSHVRVVAKSATDEPLPPADVIYVSAGATHPPNSWLDALKPSGRLIFPLTPHTGLGGMLLVTRQDATHYAASFIARVAFISCLGARDDVSAKALAEAFATRPMAAVKSLRRAGPPDATAWCAGDGWWLSTADAA